MFTNLRNRQAEGEEGFTLIELLVVMIIIGILAAIAIPVFFNQRNSGYDAATKSDVKNGTTAEETYFTDNNTYTTNAGTGTAGSCHPIAVRLVEVRKQRPASRSRTAAPPATRSSACRSRESRGVSTAAPPVAGSSQAARADRRRDVGQRHRRSWDCSSVARGRYLFRAGYW